MTDISVFKLLTAVQLSLLEARALSLVAATVVTWRLNRHVTFEKSGRRMYKEVGRYFITTAVAQGTNYLVFAILVLNIHQIWPVFAVLISAGIAAGLSYFGHRLFSFARIAHNK